MPIRIQSVDELFIWDRNIDILRFVIRSQVILISWIRIKNPNPWKNMICESQVIKFEFPRVQAQPVRAWDLLPETCETVNIDGVAFLWWTLQVKTYYFINSYVRLLSAQVCALFRRHNNQWSRSIMEISRVIFCLQISCATSARS